MKSSMKIYHVYYFFALVSFALILACSNDDSVITFSQKNLISRPSLPITSNEVRIGTQVWSAKNLNVSRYRNGDPIPQVTDRMQWAYLTTGAWCYYNNDPAMGPIYGKLYNWYAVNDPRGLAPDGYHIPSYDEWTTLINFLGGATNAGGAMKATTLWNSPNSGATNSSSFEGLPSGTRYGAYGYLSSPPEVGKFGGINSSGLFWSSSERSDFNLWSQYSGLYYNASFVNRGGSDKACGFSVRCLKN